MTTPAKLWPLNIGTTPQHAEAWADTQAVRYRGLHRVAVAPGPVEIEPWQLDTITRQVADERAASQRYADRQANSAEGCADTGDGEPGRDPSWLPVTPGFFLYEFRYPLTAVGAVLAAAALVIWSAL